MAGLGSIRIDWGYEVVADALERRNAILDFEVPGAARWLVICGQRFRQGAENGQKINHIKVYLDTVMSLARWSRWEGRLRELQGKQGVVQDAATTALDAMRKAVLASS